MLLACLFKGYCKSIQAYFICICIVQNVSSDKSNIYSKIFYLHRSDEHLKAYEEIAV